jgi:DMSO/TMAO reductase YedYZ molybdopterin-dependent catalytic subunit
MTPRDPEQLQGEPAQREMTRLTRRGLLWSAVSVAGVFTAQHWLTTRSDDGGTPWPFRRALEINERLSRDYFSPARLAPTFPASLAGEPRPNGEEGLAADLAPAAWRLRLEGLWNRDEALELSLAQIRKLPRVEMVTELKCIEGWSQVVQWAGVRLAELVALHPPITRSGDTPDVARRPRDLAEYVALETPDRGYYVGLDMESALHPQTLLCYEMNGRPLTPEHGAPLRLAIPVKYGIKNIKRIGTIRFTNERPPDYWAERGYDWYAGH